MNKLFEFLGWTKEDYIEFFKEFGTATLMFASLYILGIGLYAMGY